MKYALFAVTLLFGVILAALLHRRFAGRGQRQVPIMQLLVFYAAALCYGLFLFSYVRAILQTSRVYDKLIYDYFIYGNGIAMQVAATAVIALVLPLIVSSVEHRFAALTHTVMWAFPALLAVFAGGYVLARIPTLGVKEALRSIFFVDQLLWLLNYAGFVAVYGGAAVFLVKGFVINRQRKKAGQPPLTFSMASWPGAAQQQPPIVTAAEEERCVAGRISGWFARLLRDPRPYGKKVLVAVFPLGLVLLTLLLLQPAELYLNNYVEFPFHYGDFAFALLEKALLLLVFFATLVSLLPRKLFDTVLCLITGVGVAGYIQMLALNGILNSIKGLVPDWGVYRSQMIWNAVIWIGIIALTFLGYVLLKKKRRQAVMALSVFLLTVQFVGVMSLVINIAWAKPEKNEETSGIVVSGDEQLTVSGKKNTILILMDYFSNNYIQPILADYPDALDCMKDFTFYNNADSGYFSTFPSMTHLMTGYNYDNTVTMDEYANAAWTSDYAEDFYDTMVKAGYKVNLFNPHTNLAVGVPYITERVSSFQQYEVTGRTVKRDVLTGQMLTLSAYRYLPYVMKQRTVIDMNAFYTVVSYTYEDGQEHLPLFNYNADMYEALMERGLTVDDSQDYFIHLYVSGTHFYVNDETCARVPASTLTQTGKGCFVLLSAYFDELKRLGVYDDATIIISSDHGDNYANPQIIYFVKQPGETHEAYVENSAPICHDDLIPTIVASTGQDYSRFGRSIFDYQQDEVRTREMVITARDMNYPLVKNHNQSTNAFNNVFYLYRYTGDHTALEAAIRRGPDEVLPIFYDAGW